MKASTGAFVTLWVVLAVAGALGYGYVSRPVAPLPGPVPGPVIPSSHLSTLAALAKQSPAVALEAGRGLLAFADVVARDEALIKSNGQLIAALTTFEALLHQKTGASLPGYSAAVNGHLKAVIGTEDSAFTKRAEAVQALRDCAAALGAK